MESVEITDGDVRQLAWAASMAPSCFNMQPWNFVFVKSPEMLAKMHGALSEGNEWARDGSALLVVLSRKDMDCVIRDREYYMFDTGMAVGQLMLLATEMGLVTHAMAGFSPRKTREILGIPEDMDVITVIALGKRSAVRTPNMSDDQWESEEDRPPRKDLEEFMHIDIYGGKPDV